MRHSAALLASAAVLALAGCGAGEGEFESDLATASSSPTEAASPTASSSPTASPSPTEAAMPEAADGTDLDACSDGDCEVLLTEPVELVFDAPDGQVTLAFSAVGADGIEYEAAMPSGGTSGGSLSGECVATLGVNSSSSWCYSGGPALPSPEPDPGVLVLQLLSQSEAGAVVRIAMG